MIIIKVINQKVVQIALANQQAGCLASTILATKNKKQLASFARYLVQSTSQNQKVTNANNQQLIPIARNISFRQCSKSDIKYATKSTTNSKAAFSISANSAGSTAQFISAQDLEPSIVIGREQQESPLEALKRRTKGVIEKRQEASSTKSEYYGQIFNEALATTAESERRLVVLMSWLEAQEKHIEKYRQFYLDRGFDVLNVKTSPWDLLLPNVGARKISEDFVRFMSEKQYSNVVLHGFSVGGYMFGRLLLEIDQLEPKVKAKLLDSIQGLVFDSLVPFEGTCYGVANSITRNPIAAKVIENMLRLYLFLGRKIATKYYLEASEKVWGGPLRCPTLFLNSKDDKISDIRIINKLNSVWSNLGIDCRGVVVESSPHVQLFTKHPEMYRTEVEKFLKHIKMF